MAMMAPPPESPPSADEAVRSGWAVGLVVSNGRLMVGGTAKDGALVDGALVMQSRQVLSGCNHHCGVSIMVQAGTMVQAWVQGARSKKSFAIGKCAISFERMLTLDTVAQDDL